MITVRRAAERGQTKTQTLDSRHTFSFGDYYDAAQAGDRDAVGRLHPLVLRVGAELYRIGAHSSAIIKGLKCALSCLGICDDFMAEPFQRFREPERRRVCEVLEQLRPLVEGLP